MELGPVLGELDLDLTRFVSSGLFRSAVVVGADGRGELLVSTDDELTRRMAPARFAICAALGRLLGDGAGGEAAYGAAHGPQARLFETQRANAFAAELLLPLAALRAHGPAPDIEKLSEDFGISRTAARWHVQNRLPT